jgi:hypothetical protein
MGNVLNKERQYSEEFEFFGQCHIFAKGEGSVTIERKLGDTFEAMTDESGNELTFVGNGVLFNSHITSTKRLKHRLSADTPSEIAYEIVRER